LFRKSETSFASSEKGQRNKLVLRALLLLSIGFFLGLTFDYFKNLIVLFLFIALNAVFAYIKRRLPFPIRKHTYGLELVLLCTVVSGMALGSKVGMIMGVLLMIVNYLAEGRPSDYFIVTLTLYGIIGYYSALFKAIGISHAGMIFAVIYNTFAFILSKLMGGKTSSLIIFNIINVAFNIAMFGLYGELLLGLFN
jgi:uncharacterized membrane protein